MDNDLNTGSPHELATASEDFYDFAIQRNRCLNLKVRNFFTKRQTIYFFKRNIEVRALEFLRNSLNNEAGTSEII
jgi:hypothetical protein